MAENGYQPRSTFALISVKNFKVRIGQNYFKEGMGWAKD